MRELRPSRHISQVLGTVEVKMTEPTLDEIKKTLEEKYHREFKIKTSELPFLAEYEARYDFITDEIIVGHGIRGTRRLVDIAHEVGHKLDFDEAKRKGKPLEITPERALEFECEAYNRGLEAAKLFNVEDSFIKTWRRDLFPICVPCECPPPGDDKVACGMPFSVGPKEKYDYSLEEFGKLVAEYVKTGKWIECKSRKEE